MLRQLRASINPTPEEGWEEVVQPPFPQSGLLTDLLSLLSSWFDKTFESEAVEEQPKLLVFLGCEDPELLLAIKQYICQKTRRAHEMTTLCLPPKFTPGQRIPLPSSSLCLLSVPPLLWLALPRAPQPPFLSPLSPFRPSQTWQAADGCSTPHGGDQP